MSWVAIVHEPADFRLANALRRELEAGGVPCWFAARDLVAVAGTLDGHASALRDAAVVAVVVPVSDKTPDAIVIEGLAAARHGACVVPVFADVDPEGPADGAFAAALARVRAAVAGLAPPSRPQEAPILPPPASSSLGSTLIWVAVAALLSLGIVAGWSRLPTVVAQVARHLKALPVPAAPGALAAGLPLRLHPSHHDSGWIMFVQLREKARRIEYRVDRSGEFLSTGQAKEPSDLDDREPMAQPMFQIGHLTRPATIEVRYTDAQGVKKGPFPVRFDPTVEAIREAKYWLGSPQAYWVTAAEVSGKPIVYFDSLLGRKDGVRSIHYGVDTPRPDRSVNFTQDIRNRWVTGDMTYVHLPAGSRAVSVEVEFKDGTRMLRQFSLKELIDK